MNLVPSETSITDLNLFELEGRCQRHVRVKRYGTNDESLTGADWLWAIGRGNRWLQMRVQAKKLSDNGRRYDHLDHPSDHSLPRQVDTLVAKANGLPVLYCFYNGESAFKDIWPEGDACAMEPVSFGCAITGAENVQRLVGSGVSKRDSSLKTIAPLCRPWSDMVCCEPDQQRQLDRLQGLLVELGTSPGAIGPRPAWATRAIDSDGQGANEDLDADGVVVIDLDGELPERPARRADLDHDDQHASN